MLEFSGIFQQQSSGNVYIPNLLAHWPMNEGSGTSIFDRSGNNYTGTITGATWTTPGYTGSGSVLNFDGTGDYVDFGDLFYLDTFSISLRVYAAAHSANVENIILKRNNLGTVSSGTNEWLLEMTPTTNVITFTTWDSSDLGTAVSGATALSVTTWYHVVVTNAGAGQARIIYLNGSSDGSGTQGNAVRNTTQTIQIGARSANNDARYWNGRVQDVRIYSSVLTPTQVTAIYNGTVVP